jgi:adenylylsulfate kinase-like enzyme
MIEGVAANPRPWVVMVTGEPGSGKTSLGVALSAALHVPFISRDHIRGGLLATNGLWTGELMVASPREAAVDVFVSVVEHLARLGVSTVVEFVVTPDRASAFARLTAAADCVVVETRSANAAARAAARDRADLFFQRPEVLSALGHASIDDLLGHPERNRIAAEMRTDFDLPLLQVTTDDGYAPNLEAIVDWIVSGRSWSL